MGAATTIAPMGFGDAVSACLSKYVGFSGRARRAEYWYWTLFVLLLSIAAAFAVTATMGKSPADNVNALLSLALFLPGLSVLVRRLHDTDHSGWWCLLPITIIGSIVLLVWLCQEGTQGTNRFGPRTT
jgi:uncharacterized membrane protein YhaH (DUF805 family)